ncbi:MAG: hypothetical protein JO093_01230 [Acidobacteria bacterium]|nr:hypothetical protein [Acidobacteriota bacterium]MBV9184205.1 hypothetical protein [Acidobacteriota bacterium]
MSHPEWKPDGSLEERIYRFAEQHPFAEIIDRLDLTPEQKDAEKADLFFENRTFIAEVKALSTDTSSKIEAILKPYEESDDWPLFYGRRDIGGILPHLPNSEALRKKLYEAVSSAIPELVRKANRQIRVTKQTFGLPEAHGILIVLNDLVEILNPEIIAHRVGITLAKKNPDKSLQFSEIQAVWIVSEQHMVRLTPSLRAFPEIVMSHPALPNDALTDEFLRRIQGFWAAFNGLPVVWLQPEQFKNLKYQSAGEKQDEALPITTSEHWAREYRARPYLRSLSADELLTYGAKLVVESGNQFLKGSPSRHHERMRGGRRFGEFMEEFNHRNLDLRALAPYTESARMFLPARLDEVPGKSTASAPDGPDVRENG